MSYYCFTKFKNVLSCLFVYLWYLQDLFLYLPLCSRSNCASCLVSLIPVFLPYKKILFVTRMPYLHKLYTHNLSSNKINSATQNSVLHQEKHTASAQARGQGTELGLGSAHHAVSRQYVGCCKDLLAVLHPTLSYATLKLRAALQGSA